MRVKLRRQSKGVIKNRPKAAVEESIDDNKVDSDEEVVQNDVHTDVLTQDNPEDHHMNGQIDGHTNGSADKTGVKSGKPLNEISETSLMKNIIENDTYFSSLIDLIPPKIYFEGNDEIMESMQNQKKQRMADKANLSAKVKQKHFKLDPNSDHKVSEIANHFYGKTAAKKSDLNGKQNNNNSMDNKMQELRHKLNDRIIELKSSRGEKKNAKQLRESKKERKRENAFRATKQKGFAKRQIINEANDDNNDNGLQSKSKKRKLNDEKSGQKSTEDNTKKSVKGTENMPKIYNKEGNIVYSKFDFISANDSTDNKKFQKKNKLKKLLVKTKKDEQKMSVLESTDASKAKVVKEKKLWRNAIEKSEGLKVKDSSKLIDKSLKRREKAKKKSAKQWTERKEAVDKRMQAKSDKRKRNIEQRKKDKKDRNRAKNKKKGRIF